MDGEKGTTASPEITTRSLVLLMGVLAVLGGMAIFLTVSKGPDSGIVALVSQTPTPPQSASSSGLMRGKLNFEPILEAYPVSKDQVPLEITSLLNENFQELSEIIFQNIVFQDGKKGFKLSATAHASINSSYSNLRLYVANSNNWHMLTGTRSHSQALLEAENSLYQFQAQFSQINENSENRNSIVIVVIRK